MTFCHRNNKLMNILGNFQFNLKKTDYQPLKFNKMSEIITYEDLLVAKFGTKITNTLFKNNKLNASGLKGKNIDDQKLGQSQMSILNEKYNLGKYCIFKK